jgi:FlaA1/EpsC-like NDP-sugar epimerase
LGGGLRKVQLRRALAKLVDTALIFASYYVALNLRFEAQVPADVGLGGTFLPFALVAIIAHVSANRLGGVYSIVTRYIGLSQALNVVRGTLITTLGLLALVVLWPGRTNLVPLSVVIMGGFLTMVATVGVRFYSRVFQERSLNNVEPAERLLVVGAGQAADMVIREVRRNPGLGLEIVGLVDDHPSLRGMNVGGCTVLGRVDEVPAIAESGDVTEILIAIPSATPEEMARIHKLCRPARVPIKTLPSVAALVDAQVHVSDARELVIEDFLGRPPVQVDPHVVGDYLRGKRVMVTGAAGSIGSELCRQISSFEPAEMVLVDKDESALYHLHEELRHLCLGQYAIYPTSVALREKMNRVFRQRKPQVVFHAAAFKHVPLMEMHPDEAVITNVKGTLTIAELAGIHGADRMVNISTDKAVDPVSVMGATKRAGEQVLMHLCESYPGTQFCSVRFGNVLGSRGSVIPVFEQQIKAGGPVTITHPEMTRYFMTIKEAVTLVLQAAALTSEIPANGGGSYGAFVLEMGEPMKIVDLAKRLIDFLGNGRAHEIAVEYTGLRPGEKLHEELFCGAESCLATSHPLIRLACPEDRSDAADPALPADFAGALRTLITISERGADPPVIRNLLRRCVPTYREFDWNGVGQFPDVDAYRETCTLHQVRQEALSDTDLIDMGWLPAREELPRCEPNPSAA